MLTCSLILSTVDWTWDVFPILRVDRKDIWELAIDLGDSYNGVCCIKAAAKDGDAESTECHLAITIVFFVCFAYNTSGLLVLQNEGLNNSMLIDW